MGVRGRGDASPRSTLGEIMGIAGFGNSSGKIGDICMLGDALGEWVTMSIMGEKGRSTIGVEVGGSSSLGKEVVVIFRLDLLNVPDLPSTISLNGVGLLCINPYLNNAVLLDSIIRSARRMGNEVSGTECENRRKS